MKKLTIVFNDNSKIIYTIKKDYIPYERYLERHSKRDIKSAIGQQYPLKDNQPIIFI